MKTILVLSTHPDFVEVIRAALSAEEYRVIHRMNAEESEPILVHGIVSACILDIDLMGLHGGPGIQLGGRSIFTRRHTYPDDAGASAAAYFIAGTFMVIAEISRDGA